MKIKNKIFLVLLGTLLFSGLIITAIWYSTSRKLMNTYLKNISESTMLDAYHAFEYLLTDTSYMATLIATNKSNIIEPVRKLRYNTLQEGGQWNREYLDNRRIIMDYVKGLNGYKYYISDIAVAANEDCVFSANHIIQDKKKLYADILNLDQERLRTSMVMMEPIHLEGLKSTISSDYVVPAVRGIVDFNEELSGYVILYFDYGVINQMFSANLPEGSMFQVINEQNSLIFSNCGQDIAAFDMEGDGYVYNTFVAQNVGWTFHMAIPDHVYIAGIRRTVLLTGVVIAAIILLTGVLLVFFISRMTTEITVLSERMNEVSEGNLDTRYEVKSQDEIGQMGGAFNHMVIHIQRLMEQIAQEEKQKRLNEIAFLQAQINPHFISNVLNNVVWMAKIQHADNLVMLVNSLNSLLQTAMHAEEDMICVMDELKYVDSYLTIMEYSGSYDFYVEKEVEEAVKGLYIPRFILQPIVENAIYHGIPNDLSRRGCIRITAECVKERLVIVIEDNGVGMTAEEISRITEEKTSKRGTFNGIGVVNVNERIRLFFGKEYGLHYESKLGQYTKCILELPIIDAVKS